MLCDNCKNYENGRCLNTIVEDGSNFIPTKKLQQCGLKNTDITTDLSITEKSELEILKDKTNELENRIKKLEERR